MIRNWRSAARALSLLGLASLAACGAEKQAVPQAPPPSPANTAVPNAPSADDAKLANLSLEERATSYRDRRMYRELIQTLERVNTAEEAMRALNWSKRSLVEEAKTIVVAYPYARGLMRIAPASPQVREVAELHDTGAMIMVYALGVILVDGQKCADQTAPEHWFTKTVSDWSPLWRELAAMPAPRRERIIDTALRLEAATGPRRQPDPFICCGGMKSFANVDMNKAVEVPTPPGGVGRTFVVPSDPAYVPEYRPEAEYAPNVVQARGQLSQIIANLLQAASAGARKP